LQDAQSIESFPPPIVEATQKGKWSSSIPIQVRLSNPSSDKPILIQIQWQNCELKPTPRSYQAIGPSGSIEFSVYPSDDQPWEVTVRSLLTEKSAATRRLRGPPLAFVKCVEQLPLDGMCDLNSIPENLKQLRIILKQSRQWIVRERRYALLVHVVRSNRQYAGKFRNSMAKFMRNFAIELLNGEPGETWESFLRVLNHYRTWAPEKETTTATRYALDRLLGSLVNDVKDLTRKGELLLALSERVKHVLSPIDRLYVHSWFAYCCPTSENAAKLLYESIEDLAAQRPGVLTEGLLTKQSGKQPKDVLFSVLLALAREKRPKWDLVMAISGYLCSVTWRRYQPKLYALHLYASGQVACDREDWATARRNFIDCIEFLGPTDDWLRTKALIMAFSSEGRYLEEHSGPLTAAEYLEECQRTYLEASHVWPKVPQNWQNRLEREALATRLKGIDFIEENAKAKDLHQRLAGLEGETYGKPSPDTMLIRKILDFLHQLIDGDYEKASRLAAGVSMESTRTRLEGFNEETASIAALAVGKLAKGNIGEFQTLMKDARSAHGGHPRGFECWNRIQTICDMLDTVIAVCQKGHADPTDKELLTRWISEVEATTLLRGQIKRDILHLFGLAVTVPESNDAARGLLIDYVVVAGKHLTNSILLQNPESDQSIPLRMVIKKRLYRLTVPRELLKQSEELEILESAVPQSGGAVVSRYAAVLEALMRLTTDYAIGVGLVSQEDVPQDLRQKTLMSFGDRVRLMSLCKWDENLPRGFDSEAMARLVQLRNDEDHGRFGEWTEKEFCEAHKYAKSLVESLLPFVPVQGISRGRSPLGGTVVELDWALSPHLVYVKDTELAEGEKVFFDKYLLIRHLSEEIRPIIEPNKVRMLSSGPGLKGTDVRIVRPQSASTDTMSAFNEEV